MNCLDKGELEAYRVLRLKAQRSRLRRSKQWLTKEGASYFGAPSTQQQLDSINAEIRNISERIYRLVGERE